jgi:hypothetical protein
MSQSEVFLAGLLVGALASVAPTVPEAARILRDEPELGNFVLIPYGVLILVGAYLLLRR